MKSWIKVVVLLVLTIKVHISWAENNDNVYLDKTSEKYRQLISTIKPKMLEDPSFFDDSSLMENSKKHYLLALDFYNQKEYEKAIDNYVLACQDYNCFGIVYYQLGLCLMDTGNYDTAKMSFERAIHYVDTWWMEDFYSIDNNGIRRESYFSYYNIACIESLQNNIAASYEYLCEAVYHGYPYINHIKSDADLKNLFSYNNGAYLKSIQEIFSAGSNNTIAGKGYRLAWGGAPQEYHFIDRSHLLGLFGSVWPDPSGWISAQYEIKNYIIIVKNIQYHYNEEERFRQKSFTLYLKYFEDADRYEEYREIPLQTQINK
jgi:tetratricopeptide (TPR) repeat protein